MSNPVKIPALCLFAPFTAALLLLVVTPAAHGFIVFNDFTGASGNQNTNFNQYVGTSGGGWSIPWQGSTSNATISAGVTSANPLAPGTGPYLARTVTGTADGGDNKRSVMYRRYEAFNGFNPDSTHVISFLWRADDFGTGFNTSSDYLTLFGHTGNPGNDTSADTSWFIRIPGADQGGLAAGNFNLYDGNRGANTAFNANLFVDTGIEVVAGQTYQFTIVNDPLFGDWQVTIDDLNGNAYQSDTLGWRRAPFQPGINTNATTLGFGARMSGAGQARSFSIDSIAITPEPSRALLAAVGLLLVLAARRRS